MNHDTTPTPRTDDENMESEKILLKNIKTELLRKDSMSTNADNTIMTTTINTINEVERLRELLNRAIEIADEAIIPLQRSEYYMDGDIFYRQLERLRDDIARLAPAPEEPIVVNLEPSNLFVDQKPQNVSNNEWREIQKLKTQTHYHHESYCRKCKEPK